MTTRVWLAIAAAAAALVVGFEIGPAYAAANQPPIVGGGVLTVRYEDTYSIHFTASDPDGDALTVVTSPINEDWLGCDGGPATDFTCDYSSSRYYDAAPLPTDPFERTITYAVSDGVSTTTGAWNVTVLPPPTMRITGNATVSEGSEAVVHLELSSNTYGSMVVLANLVDSDDDGAPPLAALQIDIEDGQTAADVHVTIPDDDLAQPTRHLTLRVDRGDAIPYRFVPGENRITVLDNDATAVGDTTAPVVTLHRDLRVERGGDRPARVFFSPPTATDDVDGAIVTDCSPAPLSVLPVGTTNVSCVAADAAGNTAEGSFEITVKRMSTSGLTMLFGRSDHRCVIPGQVVLVSGEGFAAGASVTMFVQTANLDMLPLPTTIADRNGRVRQFVTIPATAAGKADIVVTGPAGASDLMQMIPVRVGDGARHGHRHHTWGHWFRTLSLPTPAGC
ncbi:MAG TPA: HYR domain-containing protein [Ilumatobacteraceae bacterium]|nr:HYR domain-containing protein [Ilumatobacteraceae bacterium]